MNDNKYEYAWKHIQFKTKVRYVRNKFITQYMLRQQYVMVNEQTAIIEIGLVSAR